ncbi:MAG: hypothetical protein ACRD9R_14260 [Pyrinomonadaceae bacterium]
MASDPIVITGGSVTLEFSDAFTNRPAPVGKQKYTSDGARLVKVTVNGRTVAELEPKDVVVIEVE